MDLTFFDGTFDGIAQWLEHNNDWLGFVIFMVSMVESLVVAGIIVPGVAMLFALGAIAGTGALDVYSTLVWAFAGAVAGDGLSFWLGYRYHEQLRNWWPFLQHPQWLAKGEEFFHKYGALSIVIGRFVGPVRPMIPVVAGMMDMRPLQFYSVNILSALGWAPAYLLPGFFTGAALSMGRSMGNQFPDQLFYVTGGLLLFALIISGGVVWCHKQFRYCSVAGAFLSLITFVLLLGVSISGDIVSVNTAIAQWLAPIQLDWLMEVMKWVTWLGTVPVLSVLLLLFAGWACFCGNGRTLIPLLWAVPGMEATLWSTKWLVDSPRPSDIAGLDPYSFPSGHTTQAAFVLCWIAVQLGDGFSSKKQSCEKPSGKQQWALLATSLFLVLLVALSRLILNVHWMGDVLAGLCLGLFWVCIARIPQARIKQA